MQSILNLDEAAKTFVHSECEVDGIGSRACDVYAVAVMNAPYLSPFKLSQDSHAVVQKHMMRATGEELEALLLWTLLNEDFWLRASVSGLCTNAVATWTVCAYQSLRTQIESRLQTSSGWRRKGKKGQRLKRPILSTLTPATMESYH